MNFQSLRMLNQSVAALICALVATVVSTSAQGQSSIVRGIPVVAPGVERSASGLVVPTLEEKLAATRAYQPEAGVWGVLDSRELVLELPDPLVDDILQRLPSKEGPVWLFDGVMSDVFNLLTRYGLESADLEKFRQSGALREVAEGVEFRPSDDFILNIPSDERAFFYDHVGPFVSTNPYYVPIAINSRGFRYMEAMSPSGLRPEVIDLIEQLCYRQNGALEFFSDFSLCLTRGGSDEERVRILRTIARQFSLRIRLRVESESEVENLAAYWGGDGRNKDVLPLLESVAQTPGVEKLDIIHLLPPIPRKLVNTYTRPELIIAGERPDCFSTSMSFFNDELPTRYLDSIKHVLNERYVRATKPWKLGDVVLMQDPDTGDMVHACNYIAADIVFTKNGADRFRPWALKRLSDVFAEYLTSQRLSASFYRLKPEYLR